MAEEIIVKEYSELYKDEVINLILDIQHNEFNIQIQKEDQPDLSFAITGLWEQSHYWILLITRLH